MSIFGAAHTLFDARPHSSFVVAVGFSQSRNFGIAAIQTTDKRIFLIVFLLKYTISGVFAEVAIRLLHRFTSQ
jgi:hypothetical protein